MWGQVKQGDFAGVKEYAEGTCKLVRLGGKDLGDRVFKEEADELAANRFFKAYAAGDDIVLAQKIVNWDRIYADPDAVRSAIRALADLKDAAGNVMRLSDDAVEGAVKFVAKAGNGLNPAQREELLRSMLTNPGDADALLKYVKNSPSPKAVEGMARLMGNVTCPVP